MSRALDDTLRDFGVYLLSPKLREGKALALSLAGVTEDDLHVVAEHIERSAEDSGQLPRYLGGLVNDPQRLLEVAASVRHANAKRAERAAARAPDGTLTEDGDPRSFSNGYVGSWQSRDSEDERRACEAFERARHGRVGCMSRDDHAAQMGVTVAEFDALVARGEALQGSLLAPPAVEAPRGAIEDEDAAAAARNAQAFHEAGRALPSALVDQVRRTGATLKVVR